jgi:hypothetical protein
MANDTGKSKLGYEDEAFITGEAGRPIRILSEYLQPLERFRRANIRDNGIFRIGAFVFRRTDGALLQRRTGTCPIDHGVV